MDLSIEKNKRLNSYTNGNINYRFEYDKWGIESSLFINDNLYMNFIYDESTVIFCINKLSVEDCCYYNLPLLKLLCKYKKEIALLKELTNKKSIIPSSFSGDYKEEMYSIPKYALNQLELIKSNND